MNHKVEAATVAVDLFASLLAAAAATATTTTISLRATALGKGLTAANGRTLYLFTADKGKSSACYRQCAGYWPPLTNATPTVGAGLKASLVGTTKRKGGTLQVTYGGHPLYFFAEDKKPGDVRGQGFFHFGGAWWAVSATGQRVTSKK